MIKSIKLSLFVSALSLFLLACNEKSEAGSSNEVIQESALQVAQAETEPSIIDDAMPTESADATAEGSVGEPSEEGSTDEGMGLNSEMLAELQQQCDELAVEEQVSDENKAVFIEDCMVNKTNELNSDTSSEAETTEAAAETSAEGAEAAETSAEATEATEESSDAVEETVKTE